MLFSKMIRAFALTGLVMSATIAPLNNLQVAQAICSGAAIGLGFITPTRTVNDEINWFNVAYSFTLLTAGFYSLNRQVYGLQKPHVTTHAERLAEKDAQHLSLIHISEPTRPY